MFTDGGWRQAAAWLDAEGESADIVVSTRVRLARNLAAIPFSHATDPERLAVQRRDLAERLLNCAAFQDAWNLDLSLLDAIERKALLEMHLASPDLLRDPEGRGLVVTRDQCRCVMLNEEDHLREQVFLAGFAPLDAVREATELDALLEEEMDFAYSEEFGYLTSCPTNVGTGCRLSVLIHLPALVLSGEIEKILNSLRQLQFQIRGLFGEGSAVRGALFQISNLSTLGRAEIELAAEFARHVAKVVQYERMARQKLHARDPVAVEDLAHRSLAVLRHARVMTAQEAFDRLGHVRVGVGLELIPPVPLALLNRALVQHQSAHLQLRAGHAAKPVQRARMRADFLRDLFRAN